MENSFAAEVAAIKSGKLDTPVCTRLLETDDLYDQAIMTDEIRDFLQETFPGETIIVWHAGRKVYVGALSTRTARTRSSKSRSRNNHPSNSRRKK